MKTLELLKEEYAILFCQYPSWEELLNDIPHHEIEKHTDDVAKLFAIEVAKESLKNAFELMEYEYSDYEETADFSLIINESNIPSI